MVIPAFESMTYERQLIALLEYSARTTAEERFDYLTSLRMVGSPLSDFSLYAVEFLQGVKLVKQASPGIKDSVLCRTLVQGISSPALKHRLHRYLDVTSSPLLFSTFIPYISNQLRRIAEIAPLLHINPCLFYLILLPHYFHPNHNRYRL